VAFVRILKKSGAKVEPDNSLSLQKRVKDVFSAI